MGPWVFSSVKPVMRGDEIFYNPNSSRTPRALLLRDTEPARWQAVEIEWDGPYR